MAYIEPDVLLATAQKRGIRLWFADGEGHWEAAPSLRHQLAIDRIRKSLTRPASGACECVDIADVNVLFGEETMRRPDIAIWCSVSELGDDDDQDHAIRTPPAAVVEVLSLGYETKDLTSPPFYLGHGVQDVILVDPRTGWVKHVSNAGETEYASPVTLTLGCGCTITV